MKITAKQFALSLYESVQEKSAAEVKAILKRFVRLLAKNNKIAIADKIIQEFNRIWNFKHGLIEANIISANELSKETVKLIKSYIEKLSGAKEIKAEEKIDKNILGGVIIKYGDKVFDASIKTQLEDLKNRLIK